jgi:branched-chain amino acid transport system ATP-binding protein
MLKIKNLSVHYGVFQAVKDVDLEVPEGKVVSLLGANGSGKSTILKTISGLHPASGGEIWFEDQRIDNIPSEQIVRLGIGHIPEGRRLFPYMTVMENIKMGAYSRNDKAEIANDLDDLLNRFPVLKEKANARAGTLSGGQQELLAVARGLMARPKILLMDEPCQGLSPILVKEIGEVIKKIHRTGIALLLIEHNVSVALGVADKVYILRNGSVAFEGTSSDFTEEEFTKKVYLAG